MQPDAVPSVASLAAQTNIFRRKKIMATQTVTQQQGYAPFQQPYVEESLGVAREAALQPYQPYTGDRVAQFTPLQQQAFGSAAGMAPAQQLGTATDLATQAGLGALGAGAGFTPGQFTGGTFGQEYAQQYMSPYMQSVVEMQQRDAQRQADIAATQRGAQAVQAGAYGGGRQAIMDAEAARNLALQKGDIQSAGLQSAYQQAQQQFNADMGRSLQAQQLGEQSRQYGAGLGLQGLQTALQGAGTLGQLGQQQFGQQYDITGLQAGFGGQQQQQVQNVLDIGYQNFMNEQMYPMRQAAFYSDITRGIPLSQTYSQTSAPAPSMLSQVAGTALAGYGLSRAGGGTIPSQAPSAGLMDLAIRSMRG
jgi:hypothetical protein